MKLEAVNLGRTIGGRRLYDSVSFVLAPGHTLTVQGPSGSGKSLLLRQLAGLDELQEGQVLLGGKPMSDWPMSRWRAEVLYVGQQAPAVIGTPEEFEELVCRLAEQKNRPAGEALEVASRWGISAEQWSSPWSTLSGGEQQRATLALAVSRRPSVLLLDEPTSALDPATTKLVEESLRGLTCVWVTHSVDQAARVGDDGLVLS